MNERQRRIGENEAVFREVNEQIRGLATAPTIEVVCECGTRSCTDRIEVDIDRYARVRADGTLFLLKPGHDIPETETVVERGERCWVVRKDEGGPADLARATDPRG